MAPPHKVKGLRLDEKGSKGLGKILRTKAHELFSHQEKVLAGDIEGIHGMRVSARRLYTAIRLSEKCLPPGKLKTYRNRVKSLISALGEVRDRDVFLQLLRSSMNRSAAGRETNVLNPLESVISSYEKERAAALRHLKGTLRRLDRKQFEKKFIAFLDKNI
ncbi:MAG TPA: CHAD domain-containing protein [Bacteroidota bacterium]|nr:CHAD domain-containing protein [Bacteroidota bacterium]